MKHQEHPPAQFGELIRTTRIKNRITARSAAQRIEMLPSNFSKLEHGVLLPPKEDVRLRELASAVGIAPSSEEETQFFDLAAKAQNSIALDIRDIISRNDAMPLLLRTIGNKRLTRPEIERLIDIVRGENIKAVNE